MIDIGDRIEFNARGRTIQGTVTDVTFTKRGSRNALVRAYNLHVPSTRVLVVLPDDGGGVWKISEQSAKVIGKAKDPRVAQSKAGEIINQIHSQRYQRASQGREAAANAGFYDLKPGDAIEVKFRDRGWQPAFFAKLTHNGRVGFTLGKPGERGELWTEEVRFSHPQFVRRHGGSEQT